MKVTIEIEQQDYLNAVRPVRNGCAFRALFEADGRVLLEPGCYLLVNLVHGAERVLYERWLANRKEPIEVDVNPATSVAMKSMRPCGWCGGALLANAK